MTGDRWVDRPVLVTGATGLLGGWLCDHLLRRGAQVVALVRDEVPRSRLRTEPFGQQVVVARGDICDQAAVERVLGEYEVAEVFHLAAQTIVPIANRNPVSTFESNIMGTCNVLEAARRSPTVRGVIVASSDKAYGEQPVLPYREDAPLAGRHPYDVSKSCADLIAQSYAITYGLPVAVLRCGNLFGGGDLNFNRLVPGVVRDALGGVPPVIRSDGSAIRDYLYVEDAAEAYLAVAAWLGDGAPTGEAMNFSLERPLSVREMAQLILTAMGSDLDLDVRDEASNEIPAQYLDATKARQTLGWRPQVGLEEGLTRTVEWYRSFLGDR